MASHHPIRKVVAAPPPVIPDKLYFRIGDVAKLCSVPAYVLRFWETEFPNLKPHKGGTGQRLYRKKDVEVALRIKSLLYDQGYTIPGARGVFKAEGVRTEKPATEAAMSAPPPGAPVPSGDARHAKLLALRAEMVELRKMLGGKSAPAALTLVPMTPPRPKVVGLSVVPARVVDEKQRDLFGE